MSALSIVLIAFGLLIIVSRAPFMWAPEKTRQFTLSLFRTDSKMRLLGFIFGLIGAGFVWAAWEVPTTVAAVMNYFGFFIVALAVIFMIPFPAKMRSFAMRVWKSFSEATLRIIGALSTIFGLALIWYGFGL